MGGSTDRLTVIPVVNDDVGERRPSRNDRLFSDDAFRTSFNDEFDGHDLSKIRTQFKTFDAKKATCFRLEDCRQGLKLSCLCVGAGWRLLVAARLASLLLTLCP
jgi:hypothetical protein